MPIAFTCPQCKKRLRAPDERAGLKVKCAGCQRVLTVPAPPSTPGRAVAADAGNAFDFSEPAPAAKQTTKPRPAPSRATPGGSANKGRLVLFLAIGGAAAIVLLAVVVVGGWLLLSWLTTKPAGPGGPAGPNGSTGPGDAPLTPEREVQFIPTPLGHELRYLPDHAPDIASIRPAQLVQSAVYRELAKSDPAAAANTVQHGLSAFPVPVQASELIRITYEGIPPWDAGGGMVVYTMAKPESAEQLLAKMPRHDAMEKSDVAGHTVYVRGGPTGVVSGFCVPEENIVVTGSLDQLRGVLQRNGEAVLDPDMRAALAQADFSKTKVEVNGLGDGIAGSYDNTGPWGSFNPAGVLPQHQPNATLLIEVGWGSQVTAQMVLIGHAASGLAHDQREAEGHVQNYVQGAAFPELASTMSGTTVKAANGRLTATGAMKLEHVPKFAANGLMWR
jgi:hypothetical protein